jgi:acyl-CoA thioesterase YciA
VAVEAMSFHRPVHVGDVVTLYAELLSEGRTSMVIDVEAWVTRLPSGRRLKVTEAKFVFVAVDDSGKKRALPDAAS